jgi:trehalose/maltose hydrolase-like predicted phosphorylase
MPPNKQTQNTQMKDTLNFEQWRVIETQFVPARQHHKETIFTIGNGYLSTRGSFEERYPYDCQATLVHGIWDDIPIGFTELANIPDWTSFEIWINGYRFSLDNGVISDYIRFVDLKNGILYRKLIWSSVNHDNSILLEFERFASLADPHLLAVQVKITPIFSNVDIRIRASLDSHVENNGYIHWFKHNQNSDQNQADLTIKTRKTGKSLAMSTRLSIIGDKAVRSTIDCQGCPGIEAQFIQNKGETSVVHKFVGIATSRDTDQPLRLAQNKVNLASQIGYEELKKGNQISWDNFWKHSDIIIEGDDEAQTAIRFALFQLRIAAPTYDEYVSIGAKTLSGFGYRGHVFWDTEIFILPFFTFTQPEISRNMLLYRYHTLPGARRKAAGNGFKGAQFSWESAETGDEVTPTWVPDFNDPLNLIRIWTGDIEIHISSDIAFAMYQFWKITGDDDFWSEVGIPVVLETALFLGGRAESEGERFVIRDIIGPDEYHEHVDNNAFTNRMIQWHLDTALNSIEWLRDYDPFRLILLEDQLDLSEVRLNHWRNVCENLIVIQDPKTRLFEQFEGFFDLMDVDWSKYKERSKSMQEILGIEGANKHQVIKQADVIMLLCLFRNEYDRDTWQVNWDYYNPRTDHSYGSSLGPAMQAWAACEMGQPDTAYEHFIRAARADLLDVRKNADDGIHAASAGGLWQAIVFGFAGLNFDNGKPVINPRLPSHWRRLSFSFQFRGQFYRVEIAPPRFLVQIEL